MKFTIELNAHELKSTIMNGSLLSLAESIQDEEAKMKTAAEIINHKSHKSMMETENSTPVAAPTKDSSKKVDSKTNNPEPEPEPEAKKEASDTKKETEAEKISFIQVREKLASLSRAGKQAQVRALIEKFGATKLSEINEEDYAALMQEAEKL